MLKRALKRASEELDKAVDNLRNELFAKTLEEPQTSFKTREVYDIIRRQYFDLQKRIQIISPQLLIFVEFVQY